MDCVCLPAPIPFDHLQEVSKACVAHHSDVELVAAGWIRGGPAWTHPGRGGLWTKEQAMEDLRNGIPQDTNSFRER